MKIQDMIKAVTETGGGNGLFNNSHWVNLRAIYTFSKPENDINPDSRSSINPNKNKCTHTHTHTTNHTKISKFRKLGKIRKS